MLIVNTEALPFTSQVYSLRLSPPAERFLWVGPQFTQKQAGAETAQGLLGTLPQGASLTGVSCLDKI